MSWFAHAVACSLYALGFGAYFDHLLNEPGFTVPHWGFLGPEKLLAAGIAILFAYINFRGASETGKIGNLVTIGEDCHAADLHRLRSGLHVRTARLAGAVHSVSCRMAGRGSFAPWD